MEALLIMIVASSPGSRRPFPFPLLKSSIVRSPMYNSGAFTIIWKEEFQVSSPTISKLKITRC